MTSATLDHQTDALRVRAALLGLDRLAREAVLLRYRDGLELDEIAARTEVGRAIVEDRLHRAAIQVGDAVGPTPGIGHEAPPALQTSVEREIEDAELGITPLLAARIAHSTATEDIALDETAVRRRGDELREWVRRHANGAITMRLVLSLGVAAVSLSALAA